MRSVAAGLVALAASGFVLLASPGRAWASTEWGCTGTQCQVGVGTPAGDGAGPGPGAPASNVLTSGNPSTSSGPCPPGEVPSYLVQYLGDNVITSQPGDQNPITLMPLPPNSELVVISCNRNYLTTEIVQAGQPPAGATAPPVTGADLARQAFASFQAPIPDPEFSPTTSVVGVQTWLWLQGGWSSRSATAAVPGLSATVTAQPTSVAWNMGDGHQTVCQGPGKAWNPNEPNATTDCSYTYAAAGRFTVTVTVTFRTTWSASDGTTGQLGVITGRTTVPITVDEIQAVNDN